MTPTDRPDHEQQPAEPTGLLEDPPRRRRRSVRVERWPRGWLGWAKVLVPIASVLAGIWGLLGYVEYLERQRCRDSVVARSDLRAAIPAAVSDVATFYGEAPERAAQAERFVGDGLAHDYPHPACTARWDIDPWEVLRSRDQLDPRDPLVRDYLAEQRDR